MFCFVALLFTHEGLTYGLNVMNISPEALETTCEPSPTRDL